MNRLVNRLADSTIEFKLAVLLLCITPEGTLPTLKRKNRIGETAQPNLTSQEPINRLATEIIDPPHRLSMHDTTATKKPPAG